ncbi:dihydrolipoyllysine-residue acetyltransferase component of pyruvate dehydrogenase complex, mitochondrial [Ixodes scapularis]|uniref:dihydrolipoyllysine-residue acetyltransferase component of pyruvate dehydrogenase complex, mitochondrial n=1 Tax=Ixodes scapularis TaxID=6945 RepID=UPI001C393353|nr:dihydrolipoyllysine-residue acetyltransferase component of pyruvate dehydrogenase complex, mitochondrial [Ixodes scapularis]
MFRIVLTLKELGSTFGRSNRLAKLVRVCTVCTKGSHGKTSNRSYGTQGLRNGSSLLWSKQREKEIPRRVYSTDSLPNYRKVLLPALSPTMETGTVISWEKKEGDKLNKGDLLCEIETDKSVMSLESPEEGYLAKIVVPADTKDVHLGRVLCILVYSEADIAAFGDFEGDRTTVPAGQPKAAVSASTPASTQMNYIDIPRTSMRQTIAKWLLLSKQTVPHFYLTVDIEMNAVIKLREELNQTMQKDKIKISVNDFVIKATALACKKVPQTNSSWQGTFIRQYESVNVDMAVSVPGGLVAPTVFGAEKKGLASISEETKSLASKARDKKLQPHEFQGGTITVTNLGMLGIENFSAIINPHQVCTLAVGCTRDVLVPGEDSSTRYRTAKMMSVTLSCDHRVVDGAVGAQWLQHFKQLLERPDLILL